MACRSEYETFIENKVPDSSEPTKKWPVCHKDEDEDQDCWPSCIKKTDWTVIDEIIEKKLNRKNRLKKENAEAELKAKDKEELLKEPKCPDSQTFIERPTHVNPKDWPYCIKKKDWTAIDKIFTGEETKCPYPDFFIKRPTHVNPADWPYCFKEHNKELGQFGFNTNPPKPKVSFSIGGVLFFIAFIMWTFRLRKLMANTKTKTGKQLKGSELIRGGLAVLADNDDAFYTIISFAATSFLFLGGFQCDYETTFIVMIVFFFLTSLIDTVRVLLAYSHYDSLKEVAIYSSDMTAVKDTQEETDTIVELQPTNVYEDFGRGRTIVVMLFFTQVLFIFLVCWDTFNKETNKCFDGTPNCPVVNTLGSYGLYIIGIFQSCVYMLGPKTDFGKSEQNPSFWLIMLLSSKNISEGQVLWHNPDEDAELLDRKNSSKLYDGDTQILNPDGGEYFHKREISPHDIRMWLRFIMSFLVNGVGYHILIHALPLQVAQQTNVLTVIFRAVGMMYLVDLDDSKGFKLYINAKYSSKIDVEEGVVESEPEPEVAEPHDDKNKFSLPLFGAGVFKKVGFHLSTKEEIPLIEAEKQAIIEHAREEVAKAMDAVDALSRGEKASFRVDKRKSTIVTPNNLMSFGTNVSMAMKDPDTIPEEKGAAAALLQASAVDDGNEDGVIEEVDNGEE